MSLAIERVRTARTSGTGMMLPWSSCGPTYRRTVFDFANSSSSAGSPDLAERNSKTFRNIRRVPQQLSRETPA